MVACHYANLLIDSGFQQHLSEQHVGKGREGKTRKKRKMKQLHVLPYVNKHLSEQVAGGEGGKVCAASFLTKLNKR